ncbi:PR-1-like protein [Lophium mytilinum]|uniref:PR-1-like protein n=1 Tax=Lophium mytilinum TaxID=390894 RepID=A0A6A6QIM2_9PEZI|nr:PR-1-like protein [Lophium mytilinum]
MRSSIIFSAAFAVGALAGPFKREDGGYVVTEVDVVEKTVTVVVTATGPPPAVTEAAVTFSPVGHHYSHSHFHHYSKPASSSAAAVESSSAPAYTPPASSAPAYTPPASSAPAYTPPASSSAPAYTPKPSSTPAPVSSAVYSVPAPSSSASYGGGVGPAHVTGDAEADLTEGEDYQNMVVFHHNINRAKHGAGVLTWDDDLAASALKCAQCSNTPFQHCNAGQNMAGSSPIANVSAGITEGWVNGEAPAFADFYGQANPTQNFEAWGHFSQVVWKKATKVGCGTVDCRNTVGNGMWQTVCNYDTGNVGGEYGDNVGKPISDVLAHWTD